MSFDVIPILLTILSFGVIVYFMYMRVKESESYRYDKLYRHKLELYDLITPEQLNRLNFLIEIIYKGLRRKHECFKSDQELRIGDKYMCLLIEKELEHALCSENGKYIEEYFKDLDEHYKIYKNTCTPESVISAINIINKYIKDNSGYLFNNVIRTMNKLCLYYENKLIEEKKNTNG